MKLLVKTLQRLGVVLLSAIGVTAQANNVSFDQSIYSAGAGSHINVTVSFDFSSYAMFGGGFDLVYDPASLAFVSYTRAPVPPDADSAASPTGYLDSPGHYVGAGIGTFEGFFGISSAADFGTFVFVLLNDNPALTTPCGMTLCLTPTPLNPMINLFGTIVDQELFANGIVAASVQRVPLPAAVWLLISAIGTVVLASGNKKT